MNQDIQSYVDNYNEEIQLLFSRLRENIYKSVSCEREEKRGSFMNLSERAK